MKKVILSLILFCISISPTYASTEGRMFLEAEIFEKNPIVLKIPLQKVYEENIKYRNINDVTLYTYSQKHLSRNITELFKNSVSKKEKSLEINIDENICYEKCKPNQYPYIKLYYTFNNPPEIKLIHPQNKEFFKPGEIFFSWEGKDTDGKLLEYSLEVGQDRLLFVSEWMTHNTHSLDLDSGKYFWRVVARDNSKLENVVISDKFEFEILGNLNPPKILSPQNHLTTNARSIDLIAQTDIDTVNEIYLNLEKVYETKNRDINHKITFPDEGTHVISVISKRDNEQKIASLFLNIDWTPPSRPDFELFEKNDSLFLKINNDDYHTSFVYLNDEFFKERRKTDGVIQIAENIQVNYEYNVSVLLKDLAGNESEKVSQTFIKQKDFEEEMGSLLGIQSKNNTRTPDMNVCRYKYNKTYLRFEDIDCTFSPPKLIAMNHITDEKNSLYEKTIYGTYNPYLKIVVDVYECTIWLLCFPRYVESHMKITKPYSMVSMTVDRTFSPIHQFQEKSGDTFLSLLLSEKDFTGKEIRARVFFNQIVDFEYSSDFISTYTPESNALTISRPFSIKRWDYSKIFSFPFDRNIGVTQWYGYTAYQSPHTGIDFGSYRERIYAPTHGTISAVGWDSYYGKCLSGGYFVNIGHDNGMHTVYFHLENYKNQKGVNWRAGDKIRKGDLVGISGNSGAFNCQPLGYHLHFELRKSSSVNGVIRTTHIDPVPHLDVNWNNIPTLGHQQYPGRLTGNNPHPTW